MFIQKNVKDEDLKLFITHLGIRFMMHKRSCIFCKHCTDIFFDASNGPYLFMCKYEHNCKSDGTCKRFEEDIES